VAFFVIKLFVKLVKNTALMMIRFSIIFYCVLLNALFISSGLKAQKTTAFELKQPDYKVSNSLYNKISTLDLRPDTTNFGLVQKGMSEKKIMLVSKIPLSQQTQTMLNNLIETNAKSDELLLLIRRFSFSELTFTFSEKGNLNFVAALYRKVSEGYEKLASIDTSVAVSSGTDVTNNMLKKGSEVYTNFIAKNLLRKSTPGKVYTQEDILNDYTEDKEAMYVYHTDIYMDGAYLSYQSFCKQTPDGNIRVEGDSVAKNNVKTLRIDGKFKKISPGQVYAIVHNGKPYIGTPFGFYPLQKKDNTFTFTGKISTATSTGVTAATAAFGIAGGIIAASASAVYEVRIERYTGEYIRIKEIKVNRPDYGYYD
jgi:hypothetical protein